MDHLAYLIGQARSKEQGFFIQKMYGFCKCHPKPSKFTPPDPSEEGTWVEPHMDEVCRLLKRHTITCETCGMPRKLTGIYIQVGDGTEIDPDGGSEHVTAGVY